MYLVACLLLLLSWFVPLFILPWTGWHKEVLAFAAVALAFGAMLRQTRAGKHIELPRVSGWFLGLAAVLACQAATATATFLGDAGVIAGYLLAAVMVIVVGSAQKDPARAAACLGWTLLVAGVASSVLAWVQTLNVWELGEWETWIIRPPALRRPSANMGQPNHLAILLLFALASLGFLRRLGRVSATLAAVLGTLLLTGLALTESRTGILALLLLSIWWWQWRRPSGMARFGVVAALLGFLALAWFWPQLHQAIQLGGGAGAGPTQFNMSGGGRMIVWPQLWQAVLLKPWWGWGLRNVSEAQNAILDHYAASEPYTYAHNVVLDLAIGVGLPLAIIFVGVMGVWFWRRLRRAREPVTWLGIAMVMVLGLHSMLEFPYSYAYLLFPVLFMVGVLETRLAPSQTVRVPRRAVMAVAAITCSVLAWGAWEYIQIEEDFRVARFEALKMGRTPTAYERPQIHVLKQLDTMLNASRIVPAPGMRIEQLELARQAALRFPWTALQNRYALALALNGESDEAVRQLKVMRAMHGEKAYKEIKSNWETLAEDKYPQLKAVPLP